MLKKSICLALERERDMNQLLREESDRNTEIEMGREIQIERERKEGEK